MIDVETYVIATRIDLKLFASAVREMMVAQRQAKEPGALMQERQIARCHEEHVWQWIRTISAEELADEPHGRAAA